MGTIVRVYRYGPDGFIVPLAEDGAPGLVPLTGQAVLRRSAAGWEVERFEWITTTPGPPPG
jgi:hypothetical protein